MKRLLFALLACCVLALPCRAEAAGPSPGLLVPVIPDARTGHYQITVSDAEALTAASVTRSVERTGITAKTDVFVEYPLDVEHPQTYYVTVSALPEADRIGLDAPASKTFPVTTGCCPGVEGAFILGDGSAADPYQVYTPAQLRHVQQPKSGTSPSPGPGPRWARSPACMTEAGIRLAGSIPQPAGCLHL